MDDISGGSKKHSACDECRKRKLKCSGEQLGCSRCTRQGLPCVYSIQKQMGRPRKRQRSVSGDDLPQVSRQESSNSNVSDSSFQDPNLPDLSAGDTIDSNAWAAFLRTYMVPPDPPLVTNVPPQSEISQQHPQYPPNSQQLQQVHTQESSFYSPNIWTDFSNLNSYSMAPEGFSPLPSSASDSTYGSASTPNLNSATPNCPCLPNLYLTLSALSALQSFPLSFHTIETLQTAACTAHSVVYCRICPMNFQNGFQNIMMLGTLLNCLADSWSRIIHLSAYDLWKAFYASVPMASEDGMLKRDWDESEAVYWRLWARQLVFKNVFGSNWKQHRQSRHTPSGTTPSGKNNDKVELTLMTIVDVMERRQKMWHNEIPQTDEFVEKPSFGPLIDTVRVMASDDVEKAQQAYLSQHGHGPNNHNGFPPGHAGHAPMPDHFCHNIIHNVRKIMGGIAFVMGVPTSDP